MHPAYFRVSTTAVIDVSQSDGALQRNVNVELEVGGTAPPQIGLSTEQIEVNVAVGAVVTTSFLIQNDGGSILDYTDFFKPGMAIGVAAAWDDRETGPDNRRYRQCRGASRGDAFR